MMKYVLITFLFISTGLFAQESESVSSTIKDVTVYLNGAQVTRTARVSVNAGENLVTLTGLTQGVNPQSINVKGNSNYLIKSVKHESDFLVDSESSVEIKLLESELKDLDFKLNTRGRLEQVYLEEKSLLLANKSIKGANESLLAEDLREMAAFFREHLEELEYKLLEISEEKKELQLQRTKLYQELNKFKNQLNQYSSKVQLALVSDKKQTVNVEFSYTVYNASWYATYDVRTTEVDEPVKLVYKANISQSTGVDWDNVNVTLSTGNPMSSGDKPVLKPWYISVYDAQQTYGWYRDNQKKSEDRKQAYESEQNQEEMAIEPGYFANAALGSTSLVTTSVEALITTEFQVGIPYDIPSDGQVYEVEIQQSELTSDYSYYSAPSIDNDAFLLTRLTKWSDLNLLPGDANVFYQGSFVGTSFLDPYSTNDTLDISLGKDKNIIISREKVEEFCKTNSFGGNKKTTRAFKIVVKNNKPIAVKLKLEDQVPISQRNDISVTVDNISGGIQDEKTGIVTWNMDLAPGETKEVTLQFEVKYPKKVKLARL